MLAVLEMTSFSFVGRGEINQQICVQFRQQSPLEDPKMLKTAFSFQIILRFRKYVVILQPKVITKPQNTQI